ncbi:hypothetical protein HDU97_001426 [Phlyctochytrium planicorne]|nr:hypothetical protein HDU97_001426 [Phlyctochytrium planicorne]
MASWKPQDLEVVDEWGEGPWDIELRMLQAIKEYLTDSTTAQDAATGIDKLFTLHRPDTDTGGKDKKEDPVGFLLTLWERFAKVAQEIPEDHPCMDKLTNLIEVLQHGGSVSTEEVELGQWGSHRLWMDLPLFGVAMHDVVNGFHHDKSGSSTRWRNLHIFMARVTGNPQINTDLSNQAIWIFSEILEGKIRYIPNQPPSVSFKGLEKNVEFLEIWLRYCARNWFENPHMLLSRPHGPYWAQKKEECNGEDRWDLWKERLRLLKVDQLVSEETRIVAIKCLELMDAAEVE